MPGTNGTAKAAPADDDPLDLGDLVSATKTVTIVRDGKPVKLEAFVYATAPISVYALIAQAHDELVAVRDDPTAGNIHRDQAVCRYQSQIARHLTTGMTADEADRLGGDYPRLQRYLKALGWPPPRREDAEGEAPAVGSITAVSSVTSEPSTAAPSAT